MKMLTVRLSEQDAQRVAALRHQGVEISSLVREAIARQSNGRNGLIRKPSDVERVLKGIYERYQDGRGEKQPKIDLRDRQAVARAIRKRLRRKSK
jgi:hypothetical protein